MNFFDVLLNAIRVPELRRRLIFTLGMLAVYRLGSQIPLPGIHLGRLTDFVGQNQGNLWGMANLLSGGNISRMTVFALGITPYITASIFLQLFTVLVPRLARLQKEGELGRKKITQWTRQLTVPIAMAQSIAVAGLIESLPGGLARIHGIAFYLLTMLSLTTGTVFVMWLGEQITERGIGNGISLIIFAGIVTGIPKAVETLYLSTFVTHEWSILELILVLAVMFAVVAAVVFVESSDRRIPIHYAKRVIGRRTLGGGTQHLPLKVNAAGVIPVIFASSMLGIPQMISGLPGVKNIPGLARLLSQLHRGEPLYYVLFAATVVFFCFFYVSIVFNPSEAADNLRKGGGFVAGLRPGSETAKYLDGVLSRLTMLGGLYLSALCLIPDIMLAGVKFQHLPWVGSWFDAHLPRLLLDGLNVNFYFGGTSLLIVVGVALELVNQVEAQLIMRHYEQYEPRTARRKSLAPSTRRGADRAFESPAADGVDLFLHRS
jgi:preprotein translocase subunit SecY